MTDLSPSEQESIRKEAEEQAEVAEAQAASQGCYLSSGSYATGYIKAVTSERLKIKKLQEFKDYVHKRLDDAGIPIDPESPHKEHGCRIGGRLDFVLERIATLEAELKEAREEIQKWKDEWIKSNNRINELEERGLFDSHP